MSFGTIDSSSRNFKYHVVVSSIIMENATTPQGLELVAVHNYQPHTQEERRQLERIAQEACQHPFLYGEPADDVTIQKQLEFYRRQRHTAGSTTENPCPVREENHPLFRELRKDMATRRLDRFKEYYSGSTAARDAHLYLLILSGDMIGGAYIWNGWLPVETEFVDPRIELAFIRPTVHSYTAAIVQKLHETVQAIKDDPYP